MDLQAAARMITSLPPDGRAQALNALSQGFDAHTGLSWTWADETRVVGTLTVQTHHTQPYGLVHGGVYATLAEAACSVGAALTLLPEGRNGVGVENHTRFVKASRPGTTLTVTARPAGIAGRNHTWEAEITTQEGVCCATATVVVRALDPDARVAGAVVTLLPDDPA